MRLDTLTFIGIDIYIYIYKGMYVFISVCEFHMRNHCDDGKTFLKRNQKIGENFIFFREFCAIHMLKEGSFTNYELKLIRCQQFLGSICEKEPGLHN